MVHSWFGNYLLSVALWSSHSMPHYLFNSRVRPSGVSSNNCMSPDKETTSIFFRIRLRCNLTVDAAVLLSDAISLFEKRRIQPGKPLSQKGLLQLIDFLQVELLILDDMGF